MLQLAISAFLVIGIFRTMRNPDSEFVTWGATFSFVLCGWVLNLALGTGLGLFGLHPYFGYLGIFFYFFIPYFWLKKYLEFEREAAFKFAIVIPIVVVAVSVVYGFTFEVIRGAINP